jgi:23S rRNA pseudouridine1911/1915/1917 synthase
MTPSVPIIYEDDTVVAVNKPAGLVVHADGRTVEPTLAEWMRTRYPQSATVGEPLVLADGTSIDRPGVVHRLDRDTSGVIVLAKTAEAFEHLKQQFQKRLIHKRYSAFVYGTVKEKTGSIDFPIGKSRGDFRRWSAQHGARGTLREARTEYTVLCAGPKASFVEAIPQTGRTHQIRVHFQAINHPVVCDQLYAPGRPPLFGFGRLALHARLLRFSLLAGGTVTVEAPLPEDFVVAHALLKREVAGQ